MEHSLRLPPLDGLRIFETAARFGSFSAAAEALFLTHGSVSRQVGKLERWLGMRLFDRHARGVALTPDGQRLLDRTREAFALLADTSDRWNEPRGTTVVRLCSIPSVCSLWLMPRLTRLEAGDPHLRVALQIEHRQTDLATEGVDLAIRCGRGALPGRVCVQLSEEWCYPIATPDLAAKIGPGDPERLLNTTLIHDSDAAGWRAWFAAHGLDYHPRPMDRRFEDYNLVLDAAACGLGVALARPPLVQAALEAKRIAVVDRRTALNPVAYWLDRPPGPIRSAATALAQRIAREARLSPATLDAFLKDGRRATASAHENALA